MANFNNKAAIFFNLVLLGSFLFLISAAESLPIGIGFGNGQSAPECDSVYGAEDGDTCASVSQKFNLTLEFFNSVDPNLSCDGVFVGQWLCIDGTA